MEHTVGKFNSIYEKSIMNGIIKGIKLHESARKKPKLSEELSSPPGINPVTGKPFGAKPTAPATSNTQQSAPTGGVSPSQKMYDIIKYQMRGMDITQHQNTISSALKKWETALKDQINKAGGKFSGKFEGETQNAYENLANLLSSIAFSSLSAEMPKK